MAQSEVDIANRALIRLGLQTITAATTTFAAAIAAGDSKTSTAILNTHFDDWKKELLRSHPWNFAIARMSLVNPQSLDPYSLVIKSVDAANPVNVDFTPSTGADGFDHGLNTNDVIKIEDSVQTELNGKFFYVYRTSAVAVKLYKQLPVHVTGASSAGYSENGSGRTVSISATYYTGTSNKTSKSEWSYGYQLPDTVLRLLEVGDLASGNEYVVEKNSFNIAEALNDKQILCNISEIIEIKYIEDITFSATAVIDHKFCEVLSLKIALKLSELLLKTASVSQIVDREFVMALSQAKSADAQEGSPVSNFHSTWADEMGRSF